MGLIAWYPLNGDTKNILDGKSLTGTFTSDTSGKIGSCAKQYANRLSGSCSELTGSEEFSMAMWLYYSSEGSSSGWADAFGIKVTNGTTTADLRTEVYNTTNNTKFNAFCNGVLTNDSGSGNFTFTMDTWHNIILIKTKTHIKIYLDGINKINHKILDQYAGAVTATGAFHISDTKFYGKYNDLRIYNHAISEKEIEEISLGLILHYPFNNPYEVDTENLCTLPDKFRLNGIINNKDDRTNDFIKSFLPIGNIEYSLPRYDRISDSTSIILPIVTETINNRYKSFRILIFDSADSGGDLKKILSNSGNISVSFRKKVRRYYDLSEISLYAEYTTKDDNDHANNFGIFNGHKENYYELNVWYYMFKSITLSDYENIDSLKLYITLDEADIPVIYGPGTEASVLFKDIQVEATTRPTPFIDRESTYIRNLKISDASGYNNNSLEKNGVEMTYISPIGKYSMHFDGSTRNSYIKVKQPKNNLLIDPFTINTWVFFEKKDSRDVIFGCYNGSGNSFKLERTPEQKVRFVERINGVTTLDITSGDDFDSIDGYVNDPEMYNHMFMITITYDGSLLKIYKNGQNISTTSHILTYTFDKELNLDPYFFLGTDNTGSEYILNGAISDFKIYSSCLTSDDVLNLYKVKAELSRNYDFYTTEIYSHGHGFPRNLIDKSFIYYDAPGYLRIPIKIIPHQKYTISTEPSYRIKKIDFFKEYPYTSIQYNEDSDYYTFDGFMDKMIKGFYLEKSYWTFSTDFLEDKKKYHYQHYNDNKKVITNASAYYSKNYFTYTVNDNNNVSLDGSIYNDELEYIVITIEKIQENGISPVEHFSSENYLNPKPTLLLGKVCYSLIRPNSVEIANPVKSTKINKNYQLASYELEENNENIFEIYKHDGYVKGPSFNEN